MGFSLSHLIYPKTKFSPDIVALFTQRQIQSTATSLFGIFLPIFLYEKFDFKLESVMIFYIICFGAYTLLAQVGARMMSRVGLKNSMIIAIPFLVMYYFALYFVGDKPWSVLIYAIAAVTIWRMFYWVPYHTEFAQFTDRVNRGKQIGFLAAVSAIIGIITPVVSGFIISKFGYQVLIVLIIILVFLSVIPLLFTRQVKEKFTIGYIDTFKILFTKHKRILLAYGAEGAEGAIGLAIWPIFMYKIFEGNYFDIGAISTVVIFATVVIRLFMGKYTDKLPKRRLLHWGTAVYSLGWIFKVFVQTGFDLFLASTYHNLASAVMRTPFDALTYEQMADAGHYVDEMSVFREISLGIGRIVMFALLLALVGVISLNTIFWMAAVFALLINVL
ncbi:MFS transporter [Patescibacteria group bacterium]|nr:MFS transporter [Patescibacteria group bacterium]MBU1890796.1 MFS transporter [Patescibacteria group bacterium]